MTQSPTTSSIIWRATGATAGFTNGTIASVMFSSTKAAYFSIGPERKPGDLLASQRVAGSSRPREEGREQPQARQANLKTAYRTQRGHDRWPEAAKTSRRGQSPQGFRGRPLDPAPERHGLKDAQEPTPPSWRLTTGPPAGLRPGSRPGRWEPGRGRAGPRRRTPRRRRPPGAPGPQLPGRPTPRVRSSLPYTGASCAGLRRQPQGWPLQPGPGLRFARGPNPLGTSRPRGRQRALARSQAEHTTRTSDEALGARHVVCGCCVTESPPAVRSPLVSQGQPR